ARYTSDKSRWFSRRQASVPKSKLREVRLRRLRPSLRRRASGLLDRRQWSAVGRAATVLEAALKIFVAFGHAGRVSGAARDGVRSVVATARLARGGNATSDGRVLLADLFGGRLVRRRATVGEHTRQRNGKRGEALCKLHSTFSWPLNHDLNIRSKRTCAKPILA